MWCSSCGEKLGDPKKDLHDPEGQFLPDKLGPVENPDSYHIKAVYGEKGVRILCDETGKMTKLLEHPPGEEPSEQDGRPSGNQTAKRKAPSGPVYDLEEDKQAEDILKEVVGNPAYGLSEDQILEVESWLRIYDGRIPPDMLEDVLGNLDGVSNQKAALMRQKYEALINKWIVDQTKEDDGPPIGSVASPPPSHSGGQPSINQQSQPTSKEFNPSGENTSRQDKRIGRRQEAIDTMAEEMAKNMASNAGQFYNDIRDVFTTLIKKKAERDPEWFFEKADAFGFDIIDELSRPSEAKKEGEYTKQSPQVDTEVDKTIEEMVGEHPAQQSPPSETNKVTQDEVPQELIEMEQEVKQKEPDRDNKNERDEFDKIFTGDGE